MGKGLNITIVETKEHGLSRTIVYSDGTSRRQVLSNELQRWVFA